jgi:CRP/FNR family cyclic AMP-dependent transcriptional regulator
VSGSSDANAQDVLTQLQVIPGLTPDQLETLASIATIESIETGTVLFSEGETHDCIYFVCSGGLALEMQTAKCGRQRILTVGKGDLLAWTALVGDHVMTATAVATEPSQFVTFQVDELREMLEGNSELGSKVMSAVASALARRLLATRLQLLDLFELP